jgi:uncharacterized protein (TIGR02996 family)
MTTLDALLSAIIAAPDDDAPRLVLADVLEERGQVERASFIRLQIKMARCRMCHRKDGTERKDSYAEHCGRCVPGRRRERELFAAHSRDWFHVDGPTGFAVAIDQLHRGPDPATLGIVRRGFIAEVRLPLATLIGGPCGNCEGTGELIDPAGPCPDCGGQFESREDESDKGWSPGTGRTPGLVADLGRLPIEAVRITDREPVIEYETPIGWVRDDRHVDDVSRLRADLIPADLYDCLADGSDQYDSVTWKRYPSAAAAHAALSAATIKLIRQRAGLPELPT